VIAVEKVFFYMTGMHTRTIRYRNVLLFLLLLSSGYASGHPVWISLYNNAQVQSVVVSAYNGHLSVSRDDGSQQFTISAGQAVHVTLQGEKIIITDTKGLIGAFDKLKIEGIDTTSVVRLKPVLPSAESRNYEDAVWLYADIGRIRMINQLNEDQYLSGVIEAETGTGRTGEFYKAKAVICRTYLYGQADRHASEHFHLCDETHCQAYKGRCRYALIQDAVAATGDLILTDDHAHPISATYHANCGGETESAKNAWQTDMPYLIPTSDPYCTSLPNAQWEKTISLDDWISYLIKNGFKPDPSTVTDFSFPQVNRKPNYLVNDFVLPFKQIRNDWALRSTFFSIVVDDGKVTLNGRGYGHGVGLCQDGAMEMGKRGYKYEAIIRFYYKRVNLTPISDVQLRIPQINAL
jgi:stage II sporulation protein D